MNLKDVIQKGELYIIDYINNNKFDDNDLKEIKKINTPSVHFQNSVKEARKKWIKKFLDNSENIIDEPNYILTGGYAKAKDKLRHKILDLLISRHLNNKIKDSHFFSFVKKNENTDLLNKLNIEQRETYKDYIKFENLNEIKEFEHFYKLQTSGMFNFSLTNIINFSKCLFLWDSEKEKIKECFSYYNYDSISLILNRTNKEIGLELIESYIQKHTKDSSLLFILEGVDSDYGKEKIREQFKTKMIFLSKDLKLKNSLELLEKYEINIFIIDPHGEYKTRKNRM